MKYIRNPLAVFSSILLASAASPVFSMEADARVEELAGHRTTVRTRVTVDELMGFIDKRWMSLRGLSPIASYRMVIEDLSHWISRAVEGLTFSENNIKQARGLAKLVEERGKELFTLSQLSAHDYIEDINSAIDFLDKALGRIEAKDKRNSHSLNRHKGTLLVSKLDLVAYCDKKAIKDAAFKAFESSYDKGLGSKANLVSMANLLVHYVYRPFDMTDIDAFEIASGYLDLFNTPKTATRKHARAIALPELTIPQTRDEDFSEETASSPQVKEQAAALSRIIRSFQAVTVRAEVLDDTPLSVNAAVNTGAALPALRAEVVNTDAHVPDYVGPLLDLNGDVTDEDITDEEVTGDPMIGIFAAVTDGATPSEAIDDSSVESVALYNAADMMTEDATDVSDNEADHDRSIRVKRARTAREMTDSLMAEIKRLYDEGLTYGEIVVSMDGEVTSAQVRTVISENGWANRYAYLSDDIRVELAAAYNKRKRGVTGDMVRAALSAKYGIEITRGQLGGAINAAKTGFSGRKQKRTNVARP